MHRTWIVVDLEATCWTTEEDPALAAVQRTESEIIEIGAVRIDPLSRRTLGEFQTFVRPIRHPELSGFCKELTHIKQSDVDEASPFAIAYDRFLQWMEGADGALLASWGRFDHNQLCRQARSVQLPQPSWTPLNIKAAFSDWYRAHTGRRARHGLGRAIRELGWDFEGTAHRGIDDARNAARILVHVRNPENASEKARTLMAWLRARDRPGNLADARQEWDDAKAWWHAAKKELLTLGVVELLPDGKGLRAT